MVAGLALLLAGCGGSTDGWFESSSALDTRKGTYIEQQMQYGMTEEQARGAWNLQHSVDQTHGTDSGAGTTMEFNDR